jgi:hypothetical protein
VVNASDAWAVRGAGGEMRAYFNCEVAKCARARGLRSSAVPLFAHHHVASILPFKDAFVPNSRRQIGSDSESLPRWSRSSPPDTPGAIGLRDRHAIMRAIAGTKVAGMPGAGIPSVPRSPRASTPPTSVYTDEASQAREGIPD